MRNESGFTLIESLLAISILSIVAVQILNVQSSSISVTQNSRDNMRATWALRSAISQIEYALDALGPKGLVREASFPWSLDPAFTTIVKVEDTPLEASRLLMTAMKLGGAASAGPEGEDEGDGKDAAGGFKEIGQMLDSQVPKDMYRTANVVVSWKEGDSTRSIEGGMLVIDAEQLNIMKKMGESMGALQGLMGGGGAGEGNEGGGPNGQEGGGPGGQGGGGPGGQGGGDGN
jgi:prepilin-type N-terminal cleavage/methylation domain-containing protein